jgi:hypothetical protein
MLAHCAARSVVMGNYGMEFPFFLGFTIKVNGGNGESSDLQVHLMMLED